MLVETRLGDERQHLRVGHVDPVRLHLLAQDRDARLEVGRLDVGDQAPFEAAAQPRLERRDVARRPVARHDDLRAGLVERVERVEELLLDPLLVLEELHVVDQQHVVGAVALLEALDPLVAERVDEVVHERLARDVADARVGGVLAHVLRDRLQQMRLAEAGAAVDEERVVGLRRRFGDRERGRVREAVRRADHEGVEGVLRVEAAALGPARLDPLDDRRRPRARRRRSRPGAARRAPRSETRSSIGRSRPVTSRIAAPIRPRKWPSIQSRVKSLGTPRTKRSSVELEALGLSEPGSVGRVVQRTPEPTSYLAPQALRSQLDLVLHPDASPSTRERGAASIPTCQNTANVGFLQGLTTRRRSLHSCGKSWGKLPDRHRSLRLACGESGGRRTAILARSRPPTGGFLAPLSRLDEAHLPAQRPSPQAQARFSCAHVDARRAAILKRRRAKGRARLSA